MQQRFKPGPSAVQTWEEADVALKELGDVKRRIAREELLTRKQVEQLKEDLTRKTQADVDRMRLVERELEDFVEGRREDFGKARSRALMHGKVGFRKSTRIELDMPEEEILSNLVRHEFPAECIRRTEVVDKTKLKAFSDEDLVLIGAHRETAEPFFYETKVAESRKVVSLPGNQGERAASAPKGGAR